MEEKARKGIQKILLPLSFFLFLAFFGLIVLMLNPTNDKVMPLSEAKKEGCLLDYGESQCIDGFLSTPFYNAGKKTINSTQIRIPTKNGVDIANITEPLAPNKSGVVQLSKCDIVDKTKPLKLKWCCEKCYEAEMTNPSKAITIIK